MSPTTPPISVDKDGAADEAAVVLVGVEENVTSVLGSTAKGRAFASQYKRVLGILKQFGLGG